MKSDPLPPFFLYVNVYCGFTVKLLSDVVAPQDPLADTVYLIVAVVFVETFAGVYVELLIDPPPETILQLTPDVPVRDFVEDSHIVAVLVVLLTT